jgi:hypothetical protein
MSPTMKFLGSDIYYEVKANIPDTPPPSIDLVFEKESRTFDWTTNNENAFWHTGIEEWVTIPNNLVSLEAMTTWTDLYTVKELILNVAGQGVDRVNATGGIIYTDLTTVPFSIESDNHIIIPIDENKTIKTLNITAPIVAITIHVREAKRTGEGVVWLDSGIPVTDIWTSTNPGTQTINGWTITYAAWNGGYLASNFSKAFNTSGILMRAQRVTVSGLPDDVDFKGLPQYWDASGSVNPVMFSGLGVTTSDWFFCGNYENQTKGPFADYERIDKNTLRFTYNFTYPEATRGLTNGIHFVSHATSNGDITHPYFTPPASNGVITKYEYRLKD